MSLAPSLILSQLYNLQKDLHINDTQYNLALTIFFFSYSVFEVPSNVFLKRLRPSIWSVGHRNDGLLDSIGVQVVGSHGVLGNHDGGFQSHSLEIALTPWPDFARYCNELPQPRWHACPARHF